MAPPADASAEEGPQPSPQSNRLNSNVQGTFVNRLRRKRPASQNPSQNARSEKFARLFPPSPEIENDDEFDMSAHHHGHHHHHTLHHHHPQQTHHLPPAAHHHHSVGSGLQHHHGGISNGVMRGGSEMGVRSVASSSGKFSSASSVSGTSMASVSSKSPSIASLCNLGNTCFLNSVLYTLRFTPGFLHNLHHMIADLNLTKASNKKKAVNGSLSNGHLSEPCTSGGDALPDTDMSLDIIERLHDLFKTLSCADEGGNGGGSGSGSSASGREPIPPSSFLTAVGKLNPMFEGNQQQDAHELLVMILNILEDIKIPVNPGHLSIDANSDEFSSSVPALPPPVPEKKGKRKVRNPIVSANHSNNGHLVNGISKDVSAALPSRIEAPTGKNDQQQRWLPNFVKENFEGKQVMRTRCLECELSTYRSETFTNIDVPLHLEEPEDVDELSGPDLFLKQILMSETLRENNKYWCEECGRLNEAQRSVQYELLPRVMVLQLKRFTTATGGPKSYSVSKINDYIPTPFTMNCFCTQCMSPPSSKSSGRNGGHQPKGDSKHLYKLYAVIMHLGATLASGHYIAYVRASSQDSAAMEYAQCQRGGVAASEARENDASVSAKHQNGTLTKGSSAAIHQDRPAKNKKQGIMKFLRRGGEKSNSSLSSSSSPALFTSSSSSHTATNGDCVDSSDASSLASVTTPPCQGASCCGIRAPLQPSTEHYHNKRHHQHMTNGVSNGVSHHSNGAVVHQRSLDSTDSSHQGLSADGSSSMSSSSAATASASEVWLECDDESIQVISRKQFEAILSAKQGATTPYLLFYQRLE